MIKCWGNRLRVKLNGLARSQDGIAVVEFALVLPLLLLLFMGGVEMARFILVHLKLEKAVFSIADVVAQSENITAGDLDILLQAMDKIMSPYDFPNQGYVIVSSIAMDNNNNEVVAWQYCGGGSVTKASHVGAVGATPTLPAGFTLNDKEDVIVAEVFFNYEPVVGNSITGPTEVYKQAVYRPRLGALDNFVSSCN